MPGQDTRLEAQGAEFAVLGQLLVEGISGLQDVREHAGLRCPRSESEAKRVARVSVKSRWSVSAKGKGLRD